MALAGLAPEPGQPSAAEVAVSTSPKQQQQQQQASRRRRGRHAAATAPTTPTAPTAIAEDAQSSAVHRAGSSSVVSSLALASIMAATTMQHSAMPPPPSATVTSTGPVREALYKLHYRTLQVLALPTYGKVAALFLVGVPLLVGGAMVYRRVAGTDWGESLLKVYYLLLSVPGIDISAEASKRAVFVLNLVHLASLFTFATLVGVVSEEISQAVDQVRAGNHKVPETGHTVVLGWDDRRTPLLLQQLLVGEVERGPGMARPPFVVLLDPAQANKESVDATLEEMLGHRLGRTVVTRVGSPVRVDDLERVSAGQAATVIITGPWGGGGSDHGSAGERAGNGSAGAEGVGGVEVGGSNGGTTRLLACLAALHSVSAPGTSQSVILDQDVLMGSLADGEDAAGAGVVKLASRDVAVQAAARLLASKSRQLTAVTALKELSDMLALTVFNPGLSAVFEHVCVHSEGTAEFYIHPGTHLEGRSMLELRRRFHEAVVCGTLDARTGVCRLNAPDGYRLKPDDRLVLLSSDAKTASKQTTLTKEEQLALDEEASALSAASAAAAVASSADDSSTGGLLRRRKHVQQQQHQLLRANSMSLNTAPCSNPNRQQHVVVLMGEASREVVQLLNSMGEAAQHVANLRITLVGKAAPPHHDPDGSLTYAVEQALARARRLSSAQCTATWLRGDSSHMSTLLNAGVADAQAVVLAPGPETVGARGALNQDVDSQVLAHTLRLVEILHRQQQLAQASSGGAHTSKGNGNGWASAAAATASLDGSTPKANSANSSSSNVFPRQEPLRLIASVVDESTRQVLESVVAGDASGEGGNYLVMPELMLQDKIMSGLLGQVTLEPLMHGVFEELLSQQGAELYTRPPEHFGLPVGKELEWSKVTEVVRGRSELAVGLVRLSTDAGEAEMGLPLDAKVVLRPRDRIVVLADE